MRLALAFLVAFSLVALAATIVGNVPLDYGYYLDQWHLVLSGQNPWSGNNAYGPLHNAFALLVPIDPLAPKLLTAALLLIANAALVTRYVRRQPRGWVETYAIAFAANPLVLVSAFWLGLNDSFVAALVIAAALERNGDRLVLAGVLLGLATLDKYYPGLLIPLFAMDARRIEPKLILSAVATIVVGLAAATSLWSNEWLDAVTFGVSRDATILSVLHPIALLARANGLGDVADLFVRFNGPLVLIVWIGAFICAYLRAERWLLGAVWSLFAVLLTYKVGNQQFWVCWLALVACLPLLNDPDAERLARLSWPYAIFLGIFEIGYVALVPQYYQGPWHWIVDWVGLVSFVLGLAQLIFYFRRPVLRPAT